MGTRGAYGFYKDGESKIAYNQFEPDSEIVKALNEASNDEVQEVQDAAGEAIEILEKKKNSDRSQRNCEMPTRCSQPVKTVGEVLQALEVSTTA